MAGVALQRNGFAVIENVLNDKECEAMRKGMWDHAERLMRDNGGLCRDDPTTYANVFKLYPNHGMLHQHHQWGVCQAAFDVRQNPKVIREFEKFWGTQKLTSSIDGVGFGLPPEITGRGWEHNGWLHLDQSPSRNGLECIQGWVTAETVGEGDATLRVLKGSHRLHAAFADAFDLHVSEEDTKIVRAKKKADWYKLNREEIDWYLEQGCEVVDIQCPVGSQVLWDSRTVHSGKSPSKGRAVPRTRYVVYTSYLPISTLTPQRAEKKRKCVIQGRMTSHWADCRKMFSKHPRTYGGPLIVMPHYVNPRLTRLGASLFGWHNSIDACPFLIQKRKRAGAFPSSSSKNQKTYYIQ